MRAIDARWSPAKWIPHPRRALAVHGWHAPSPQAWVATCRSPIPAWRHGPRLPWPWFDAPHPAARMDQMATQTTTPVEAQTPRLLLLLLLLHFPWPDAPSVAAASPSCCSYQEKVTHHTPSHSSFLPPSFPSSKNAPSPRSCLWARSPSPPLFVSIC